MIPGEIQAHTEFIIGGYSQKNMRYTAGKHRKQHEISRNRKQEESCKRLNACSTAKEKPYDDICV